jgi:hypothetical protein
MTGYRIKQTVMIVLAIIWGILAWIIHTVDHPEHGERNVVVFAIVCCSCIFCR